MGIERTPKVREPDREDRRLMENLRRACASDDRRAQDRAFEAIWHRHVATVSLVCARYLQDDHDILSVTDEVFLRFYRSFPALTMTVPLRAYLAAVARNASIDCLRASARRNAGLFEPANEDEADPLLQIPDPNADVGASVRYRELIASLRAVLCAEEVDIILAHAVWGETFGEIAARLHKKENTVKTIYHRALKAYRHRKGDDLP